MISLLFSVREVTALDALRLTLPCPFKEPVLRRLHILDRQPILLALERPLLKTLQPGHEHVDHVLDRAAVDTDFLDRAELKLDADQWFSEDRLGRLRVRDLELPGVPPLDHGGASVPRHLRLLVHCFPPY